MVSFGRKTWICWLGGVFLRILPGVESPLNSPPFWENMFGSLFPSTLYDIKWPIVSDLSTVQFTSFPTKRFNYLYIAGIKHYKRIGVFWVISPLYMVWVGMITGCVTVTCSKETVDRSSPKGCEPKPTNRGVNFPRGWLNKFTCLPLYFLENGQNLTSIFWKID